MPSGSGSGFHSQGYDAASPAPSHFSAISRASTPSSPDASLGRGLAGKDADREVFRWAPLRVIEDSIFPKKSQKASAVLGSPSFGSPTVIAANGLICVGTEAGSILVFDFKQTLKCVCGSEATGKIVGPVTSLALSHDHTYVASGHITGHIQLFDLNNPLNPARSVAPTSLAAVLAGRQEGHIYGSRIVAISFVAGRHTGIVSADEHGLAFYHSLGKILFVDASDVLRILGKYPEDDPTAPPEISHNGTPRPWPFR
ncbi:hypothetical protein JAAARDRAFT_130684, partial [Jaapia argillacea MUCL 33604]